VELEKFEVALTHSRKRFSHTPKQPLNVTFEFLGEKPIKDEKKTKKTIKNEKKAN
jgi:hypothetical protein